MNTGSCYSFNSGRNFEVKKNGIFKSKRAGTKFGLQLELYIGDPKTQQQYTDLSGIKILSTIKLVIHFLKKKLM